MNAVADKLDEARALIEGGWSQCRYAINAAGESVDVASDEAVAFCATGALNRIFTEQDGGWRTASDLLSEVVGEYITVWNDHYTRTKPEVVAAFKRAAELARAGEA